MNKYRKHILLAVLGAMVLFYASDWLLRDVLEAPFKTRREDIDKLQKAIDERESELKGAMEVGKRLDVFRAQSLPANSEYARSLYQAWLLELVNYVKLSDPTVDVGEPANRRGLFQVLACSIRGRADLPHLIRLLYEFYNAGHLHQIRALTLTPLKGSDQLDVTLSIEALVLPDATRKDRLSTGHVDRLAYGSLRDYDLIAQRNLFGAGGASDATDSTYLTAVNYVDGKPEAWFDIRTEGKLLKLRQGQQLKVGPFVGTLAEISDTDVLVQSDGELWLLSIGENLAQAAAIPPER
jgi:hypothetical protein